MQIDQNQQTYLMQVIREYLSRVLYSDETIDTPFPDGKGGQFTLRPRVEAALKNDALYEVLRGGQPPEDTVPTLMNVIGHLIKTDDVPKRPRRPISSAFPAF